MERQNNRSFIDRFAISDVGKFMRKAFTKEKELKEYDDEGSEAAYGGKENRELYTKDGTVDRFGKPAIKGKSGGWKAAALILVNQGLATLGFFGMGVNLVLFLTRVLQQGNASAANDVSKWTGTVYIFSLVGAFLSDAYWGRYRTCAVFQVIFTAGLVLLSLSSYLFLLKPTGCGDGNVKCVKASPLELIVFYMSIYLIALGYGGYQPNIATFGADQFDEEDRVEGASKVAFFSWFYLAMNLGQLFSNSIIGYFENIGSWVLGFWMSAGSAALALIIFLVGTPYYRHLRAGGNPIPRFTQVFVSAFRKWNVKAPSDGDKLYELQNKESAISGSRKIGHSEEFRFLDKAATETEDDITSDQRNNPWRLCTVTQVEEVKCILRMLPIWLCTIIYSVVFTQMASLFVEQGAAMKNDVGGFQVPPASMSIFDILSVAAWILLYRRVIVPFVFRITKNPKGLTELQRMGGGLILGMLGMIAAGVVEQYRLKFVSERHGQSSLSIFWQTPQYFFIGASEVFMYVGQLEFFNGQAPDGLRSFGSALCMTSISFGNYVSSLLVSIVMDITRRENQPGWIPGNLNRGHMDRFYFLLAALTAVDFVAYVMCARWYRCIVVSRDAEEDEELAKI